VLRFSPYFLYLDRTAALEEKLDALFDSYQKFLLRVCVYPARKPRNGLRICLQANNIIKQSRSICPLLGTDPHQNNGTWRHK
jgi:hypothetical protein